VRSTGCASPKPKRQDLLRATAAEDDRRCQHVPMTSEALLVMDIQNGVVERIGEQSPRLLSTLADAVAAARLARIPIIFVRVAFRGGAPEISPKNLTFSAYLSSDALGETDHATQVHPAVAPQPGEIVVTKKTRQRLLR
jgi:nicotinamidase-related amidase